VDEPIKAEEGNTIGLCTPPTFAPNTSTKRNILVEDFTGHYCNNCPSAAYSIDTIKASLGKQVVPVGIHVTSQFAAPVASKAPKYQTDFRTAGGTEIKNSLAPAAGLPAIFVSRKDGFTTTPGRLNVYLYSLSADVRSLIGDSPKVRIQTKSTFDNTTNRVCAYAEVEILDNLTDDHSVVFMLLEDSVVDYQLYNGNGGDPIYGVGARDIPDYVHKHVLRKMMNGWQGKKIISAGSTAIGDKIVEGSTFVITDGSWRTNHLEIVAYVYNNNTKEVIQAYSEKLN
jgi:hypothetical protein